MSIEWAYVSNDGQVRLWVDPDTKTGSQCLLSGSRGPIFFLDTLVWTSISELPIRVLVRQGRGCVATWDFDVVEQTPLRADAHRGVYDAFPLDRSA